MDKYKNYFILILLLVVSSYSLKAQKNTEYQILIKSVEKEQMVQLTKIVSIDNYDKEKRQVEAYVNERGLKNLQQTKFKFSLLNKKKSLNLKMAQNMNELNSWDVYPSYEQYVEKMHQLADSFPEICRLDTIGKTIQGRLLLSLKISDSVNVNQTEPGFFYTSTMHGDEVTGYVLLLRLADYLVHEYGNNNFVNRLVNNIEIYINPLANPDGSYYLGNSNISGARRYNANSVDLNRNFPNPLKGEHFDGEEWQPETKAMMDFFKNHHLVMSANFHGGSEVINYPWDTYSMLHADDQWYQFVSRIYADTLHAHSTNYFTGFDNGITNGYAWYVAYGTRQDYANYYAHCKEVTIELSNEKTPLASKLPYYWEANYRSLLYFMEQVLYGVNGKVIDKDSGNSLVAEIHVLNHDKDNSFVVSDSTGIFYRPIEEGSYDIVATADGYKSDTIKNVNVINEQSTSIQFELEKGNSIDWKSLQSIKLFPNPAHNLVHLQFNYPFTGRLKIYSVEGIKLIDEKLYSSKNYIQKTDRLSAGLYFLELENEKENYTKRFLIK